MENNELKILKLIHGKAVSLLVNMKDVLARLFFFYGMLLFAITMVPVALVFWVARTFLPEHKSAPVIQHGFQVWMGIYLPLVFCSVRYKGRHNFKPGKNYVVTVNHNSLADVPVSSPGIPGINKTLAKIEMAKIPIFGYIYSSGSILVDRSNNRSKAESFFSMVDALKKGYHLCLFPEGTRNKTEQPLAPFFDGAFKVAIKAQKPIIPALIFGTKNILHPHKKYWAWPHRIEFHFLPEVPVDGLKNSDSVELQNKVFAQMHDYYVQHAQLI